MGWTVGAAGALVLWATALVLPASIAVVLSMAATIRLTGAFHEDGWADACDGLGGGWERPQVLTIMKGLAYRQLRRAGLTLMLLGQALALIELANIDLTLRLWHCWWPIRCRDSPRPA